MLYTDHFVYKLRNRKEDRELLTINCQIPKEHDVNPNAFIIGVVQKGIGGNPIYFRKAIELIRKDLKKKIHPEADIVSLKPNPQMEKFYERLGAKRTESGLIHFPENLRRARLK